MMAQTRVLHLPPSNTLVRPKPTQYLGPETIFLQLNLKLLFFNFILVTNSPYVITTIN